MQAKFSLFNVKIDRKSEHDKINYAIKRWRYLARATIISGKYTIFHRLFDDLLIYDDNNVHYFRKGKI